MKEDNYIDAIFNETASEVLKKYIENSGCSSEQIARKMKNPISRQLLYKYKHNKSKIKLSVFNDLCYALGLNPADVFNEISVKAISKTNNYN